MGPCRTYLLGLTVVALIQSSPALASNSVTPEQAKACDKELADSASWGNMQKWPYPLVGKLKEGAVSAGCKAEIERRATACTNDPSMQGSFRDIRSDNPGMTINDMCNNRAFSQMGDDQVNAARKEAAAKKAEEDKAAADKVRQEKVAQTELPKATRKDAALEKAVAAAYDRDYPGNKVIKVILGNWSTDYEKDAFGRVTGRDLDATVVNKHPDGKCELHYELWMQQGKGKSFSGPLSARGAGSMQKSEILCSKVEGGSATADATTKKKRAK